jgi:hypothetical protein
MQFLVFFNDILGLNLGLCVCKVALARQVLYCLISSSFCSDYIFCVSVMVQFSTFYFLAVLDF